MCGNSFFPNKQNPHYIIIVGLKALITDFLKTLTSVSTVLYFMEPYFVILMGTILRMKGNTVNDYVGTTNTN